MEVGTIDYKALGLRVRSVRERNKLTQEAVSDKTGLSLSHISNIETGNTKVSLPTLKLLADIFGTTVDEFLADSALHEKTVHKNNIASELKDCSPAELRYFAQMIKNEKQNLRNNFPTQQNNE